MYKFVARLYIGLMGSIGFNDGWNDGVLRPQFASSSWRTLQT
jgi:hypothetical protein